MKDSLIFITGGHATPAIACIDELKRRGFQNLIYIGQKKSILFDKNFSSEFRSITEKVGIPFKSLVAGKFSRYKHWSSIIWLLRLPIGFFQALYYVLRYKPKIVLTFGSHVGIPIVFWSWIRKIPVVAHEQTTVFGKANKLIQKFATKVCISWENTLDEISGSDKKFVLTGNPVRSEVIENMKSNKFLFSNEKPILFITGGNQGAHTINNFIFNNIKKITEHYNVIHQTGSNTLFNDYKKALEIADTLPKSISYISKDYLFTEEMVEATLKADVIICRSGANTITEILIHKKRCLLIPLPFSKGNEQYLNAKLLEELGLGIILNQSDLDTVEILDLIHATLNLKLKNIGIIDKLSALHRNAAKNVINILIQSM